MGERDVVTEEPRLGHLGDHATLPSLRTGMGVNTQTRLPGTRPFVRERWDVARRRDDGPGCDAVAGQPDRRVGDDIGPVRRPAPVARRAR
jgi:hypothetical protein